MPDLEPITREEMLLDGEDLTPITRKEKFIKRIYDKTQSVPKPITREEMFLKKAGEGGGGDIDLQTLNVTENGTVNAPSGVAYNKVVTNVPSVIPENAYLLEEIDEPTEIATFNASALPMPSLKVGIEPVQAGSGDPSPSNVRPISGWSACNIPVNGVNQWDEEWELGQIQGGSTTMRIRNKNPIPVKPNTRYSFVTPVNDGQFGFYDINGDRIRPVISDPFRIGYFDTPSNCYYVKFSPIVSYGVTYNNDISINYPSTDTSYHAYNGTTTTIPFVDGQGQSLTVYGGSIEAISGLLDNTLGYVDMGDLNFTMYLSNVKFAYLKFEDAEPNSPIIICSQYKHITRGDIGYTEPYDDTVKGVGMDGQYLFIKDVDRVTGTGYQSSLQGVQLIYKKATPQTIPQRPTSINSLDGENNVFADCGNINELKYFAKEE